MWVVLIFIPYMVKAMDPLLKDLLTPALELGESCGYDSCPHSKEGWLHVHLVPHSHAELGYTKTFYDQYTGYDDIYDRSSINMKRVFDSVLTELWARKDRRFLFPKNGIVNMFSAYPPVFGCKVIHINKFTLSSSEFPYFFHWWSKRDGTVHRMVYELVRQGRLVFVGGGWGMVDEATTYYQSLIDSYSYSLRKLNATFLTCGRPLVAWQADVFGHSREHTSIVSQMGFDGLFINPMSFDDELIRMERKGLEFIWRGSDDLGFESDIYTHKLFDGYWSPPGFCFSSMCCDPLLITSDTAFSNIDQRVKVFIESMKYRQAPYYNTRHVLVVMGQRMGYFNSKIWFENIDKLIVHVNKKTYKEGLKIHLMYSSPTCYLKAVKEDSPTLETKQDDFLPFAYNKYSYASGMFTSRPAFKYFVRRANIYLQIAKQLQVVANLQKKEKILEDFKWIVGVVQDHNIITGAMRPYVMSYYINKLHTAIQNTLPMIGEAFSKLRRASPKTVYRICSFNTSSCQYTKGDKFQIIVYNPLAWSVNVSVRIPILNKEYEVFDSTGSKIKSVSMIISDQIQKLPKRQSMGHELIYKANVPPMGFNSYNIIIKRGKRSIIKKVNKNQQKTYFIRQVPSYKTIFDYDDGVDKITDKYANITNDVVNDNYNDSNDDIKETLSNTATPFLDKEESVQFRSTDLDPISRSNNKFDYNWTYEEPIVHDKYNYQHKESNDTFIRNKYIQINLDEYRKVTSMNLSNGIHTMLDIQFYYYNSDESDKNTTKIDPGVYIFRANNSTPVPVIKYINTKVYKSDLVEEIHCEYSNYASFVVKLYEDKPVVEVDWVLGPVPIEDGLGKDVFLRYTTSLNNNGVFFTDSNGRQMIKRIRNKRPMYEPYHFDPLAGNFYPVITRIYMEDLKRNLRFSIFNDRAQGGTSILEGSIDLFVTRRILTEDAKVQCFLNEMEYEKGLIVRGSHHLYLTKADFKQNRLYEKKFSKEIELQPQIFVSNGGGSGNDQTFTALKTKLPFGLHILSLEKTDNLLLLRLENYLEKADVIHKGVKRVNLQDLFVDIKMTSIEETTLGGHVFKKDWTPLKWKTNRPFIRSFNDFYGGNTNEGDGGWYQDEDMVPSDESLVNNVIFVPQQIRTFIIEYKYKDN